MQIIQVVHHCLCFKLNKQRFLFGLTHTLSLDSSRLVKISVDHIVLPSSPYISALSANFWHLQSLPSLNSKSIIMSDQHTKKRIEYLLSQTLTLDTHKYSWSLFSQFQIEEDHLIKALLSIKPVPPIAQQPFGIGFNPPRQKLNIVVTDRGRTVLFIHGCDVFLLDPSEKIEQMLEYYGIPLIALKGVILTSSSNLNWFQCLMKMPHLQLITEESIYSEVMGRMKSFCLWTSQMLKKRVKAKVLCQPDKWHKLGCIEISFNISEEGRLKSFQFLFGLKKIKLCLYLDQFPSEIINQPELEYLIAYDIDKEVKKHLQSSPEAYRKKIIFNRVTHKYHNKYFFTLSSKAELLTIKAHPHVKMTISELPFRFREKDQNSQLSLASIGHGERWNAEGRVVYLRQGYLLDDSGKLHKPGACIIGPQWLQAQTEAIVMHQPESYVYFYHGRELAQQIEVSISESLISKIKENSFISSLQRRDLQRERPWSKPLGQQFYHTGSQWDLFNRLCQLKTFEVSSVQADSRRFIYFVVKGAMKFCQRQAIATKNMFIGNFKRLYNSCYDADDKIQVLKDTWALQVPLKALHQRFCIEFPQKMYDLFIRPSVFL